MALTKTTTGDLSKDAVDFFIKARLEEHGQVDYIFRSILRHDTIPAGNGQNIKFVRVPRIVLAGELTEGVPPTADTMDAEFVTASATQYGQLVKITDVVQLTLKHDFVQRGMRELAESAARKDDAMIQEVLGGAANVFYGGGKSSRSALTENDTPDTDLLRQVLMQLEVGDGIDGSAPRFPDGHYHGAFYTKHCQDLLNDVDFRNTAYRQDASALKNGVVSVWSDIAIRKNRFGPHFTNETLGSAADSASGTGYDNGAVVRWGIVRRHKKKDLGEGIYDAGENTMSANKDLEITTPSDDDYWYDVYADDDATGGGTRRLVAERVAASTTIVVGDQSGADSGIPTSDDPAIPEAPAEGVTVYRSYVMGTEAASVVDLDSLETYFHNKADKEDPLGQYTAMGTKWFDTACILNDAFLCVIEAPSAY